MRGGAPMGKYSRMKRRDEPEHVLKRPRNFIIRKHVLVFLFFLHYTPPVLFFSIYSILFLTYRKCVILYSSRKHQNYKLRSIIQLESCQDRFHCYSVHTTTLQQTANRLLTGVEHSISLPLPPTHIHTHTVMKMCIYQRNQIMIIIRRLRADGDAQLRGGLLNRVKEHLCWTGRRTVSCLTGRRPGYARCLLSAVLHKHSSNICRHLIA